MIAGPPMHANARPRPRNYGTSTTDSHWPFSTTLSASAPPVTVSEPPPGADDVVAVGAHRHIKLAVGEVGRVDDERLHHGNSQKEAPLTANVDSSRSIEIVASGVVVKAYGGAA